MIYYMIIKIKKINKKRKMNLHKNNQKYQNLLNLKKVNKLHKKQILTLKLISNNRNTMKKLIKIDMQ